MFTVPLLMPTCSFLYSRSTCEEYICAADRMIHCTLYPSCLNWTIFYDCLDKSIIVFITTYCGVCLLCKYTYFIDGHYKTCVHAVCKKWICIAICNAAAVWFHWLPVCSQSLQVIEWISLLHKEEKHTYRWMSRTLKSIITYEIDLR